MFNSGEWKFLKKSGFFKEKYYNPEDILFQHLSVEESVLNDRRNRFEEISPLRNGYITRHSTSVDIKENVRVGGLILDFLESFICDNLDFNPSEHFVIDMTAKRNQFKKEQKELLQTLTEKQTNAVYDGRIRREII